MSKLEFKLPDIGEGVHEGEIVQWLVAEGAQVEEDDPVVEVMTDKATVEIPAPASGVVSKHHFGEGDVAKVGDVIFVIESGASGAAEVTPAPAETAAPAAPAEAPAETAAPAAPVEAPAEAPAEAAVAAVPAAEPVEVAPAPAAAEGGGTLEFKLPDIGEGVHEGEVVQWLVAVGATVAEDDPIVEVMTDKATVEIPSPAAGVVSQHNAAEGEVIKVGDVLFVLQTGGGVAVPAVEAPASEAPVAEAPAAPVVAPTPAAVPTAVPAPVAPAAAAPPAPVAGGKVLAAPATRRLAREMGVDLSQVVGSGPRGRVRPEDVRGTQTAPASAPVAVAPAPPVVPVAAAIPTAGTLPMPAFPVFPENREVERVPFRGIRRKVAEAMSRSKFTAPHFSLIEEVDCTSLVTARTTAKASAAQYGIKVTYMPYIMKAVAQGLLEFPQLNAELDEEAQEIIVKKYVNLGIAVDTPNGLVVPVIRDAHLKSILQLSVELSDIAVRAREGRLKPADFKDSTFTISNAGNIGGVLATPIINFPEAAIMGVHSMRKMPRCVGDKIVARDVMNLSISIDHRLVDGADGARFIVRVRDLLEGSALVLL
jgi:pyruvate dehydrogenase E2 component (dihydrolipoamide acetyltransferase)